MPRYPPFEVLEFSDSRDSEQVYKRAVESESTAVEKERAIMKEQNLSHVREIEEPLLSTKF